MRASLKLQILLLAVIGLWVIARPYAGVQHDGVLYLGQVLSRAGQHFLENDPFFAGGSQDSFSIFSRMVLPLDAHFGFAFTHRLLIVSTWAASSLAFLLLLRKLAVGSAAVWGLLSIAVFSSIYGGLRVFSFTEAFLTARSLAEPLVLFSLVALVSRQLLISTALQLAAALIHPLMALPALAVTWLLAIQRDRRWLWLLVGLPLVVAGALAGISPLDRLLQTYDSAWWALVSKSNSQTVFANWDFADWQTVVADLSVLLAARFLFQTQTAARQLLDALLIATAGLMTINIAATELLHAVLITQLQLWRVLWLVHILSLGLAPFVAWQWWQHGGLWRLAAALLAAALVNSHAASSYGTPILVGLLATLWAARRDLVVSVNILNLALGITALIALSLNINDFVLEFGRLRWRPNVSVPLATLKLVVTAPMMAFCIVWALWWATGRSLAWRTGAFTVSAALAIFPG